MSGPVLTSRLRIGIRVIEGINWKWGDQVDYIHMSHDTYIHTHLDTKWPPEAVGDPRGGSALEENHHLI